LRRQVTGLATLPRLLLALWLLTTLLLLLLLGRLLLALLLGLHLLPLTLRLHSKAAALAGRVLLRARRWLCGHDPGLLSALLALRR